MISNMKAIFRKISSVTGWITIALLSLSLTSMIVTGYTTGKPTIFGVKPMIVMSESMLPGLEVGDIIVGVPVTASELTVGDVAAYELKSSEVEQVAVTVVHRIVEVTEEGFVFKGDNNEKCDELVKPEQILYKIVYPEVPHYG